MFFCMALDQVRLSVRVTRRPVQPAGITPEGFLWLCGAPRRAWGQTEVVRAFFDAPAKSRNGLPGRRPVVGNAISLRLELPAAVIEEWFGK